MPLLRNFDRDEERPPRSQTTKLTGPQQVNKAKSRDETQTNQTIQPNDGWQPPRPRRPDGWATDGHERSNEDTEDEMDLYARRGPTPQTEGDRIGPATKATTARETMASEALGREQHGQYEHAEVPTANHQQLPTNHIPTTEPTNAHYNHDDNTAARMRPNNLSQSNALAAMLIHEMYQSMDPQKRRGALRRISDVVGPEVVKQYLMDYERSMRAEDQASKHTKGSRDRIGPTPPNGSGTPSRPTQRVSTTEAEPSQQPSATPTSAGYNVPAAIRPRSTSNEQHSFNTFMEQRPDKVPSMQSPHWAPYSPANSKDGPSPNNSRKLPMADDPWLSQHHPMLGAHATPWPANAARSPALPFPYIMAPQVDHTTKRQQWTSWILAVSKRLDDGGRNCHFSTHKSGATRLTPIHIIESN